MSSVSLILASCGHDQKIHFTNLNDSYDNAMARKQSGKDGSKAGREKRWQDSSNGTAFRVHILVIMQFCQDILGISNLKKL